MRRILTYTFLCISIALAWWALELQAKLVVKEKQLAELRSGRDSAQAAETQAKAGLAPLHENIARLTAERDEARAAAGKVAVASAEHPPFPRPPVYAAYFAEATKAKKASSFAKATADKTTGRPVRSPALSTAFTGKANS